jgi:hypothetical protein
LLCAGLETQNLFTIFHVIVFALSFISLVFAVRAFFTNLVTFLVPTAHISQSSAFALA